ncbi:MAG: methyltransferase [Bacteroidota bacterium]|nr:methyltransferase [Bacteroidota bacterium]
MSQANFNFKSFSIVNPKKGLKVTTDACLLGAVANYTNPKSIIDIGCGSGVIALMLAQKYPLAEVTAIDIDENAIENARINIDNSKFSNHFNLIIGDFLSYNFIHKSDLLVCNPPYFSNHLQNQNSDKRIAIHNLSLDFDLLIQKVVTLMHQKSCFWVILPPYEMQCFIKKANSNSLNIQSILTIFNQGNKHFRDIVCFKLENNQSFETNQLLMFDNQNKMTYEYHQLMFPYYLDK